MDDLGTVDEVEAGECLDPAVLAQAEFLGEEIVDRLDAVDFALLDAAQRGIEHLERARHLQTDQAVADILDARGCAGERHGRPALASGAPIASADARTTEGYS